MKTLFPVHTRRNLALSLVLAISLVGVSYGAGGVLLGNGLSESTAYLIEDLADFDVFAGNSSYWASGIYTKLACDIDLTGRSYPIAVIAPERFDTTWPFDGIPFEGIFDGNGHVIRNLTIDTLNADNNFLGLFGGIEGSGAQVKNLGIENINITGGIFSLGGLCGENEEGTITNCYAACSIISGPDSWYIGGLCGHNNKGTVTDCYATGSVSGRWHLGGLCGENSYGEITNCYATNAVTSRDNSYYIGGLCGENYDGTINNCYATGSITGGDNSYSLGGLCGYNSSGPIADCFWDTETSGMSTSDGGTGKTTAEMQIRSTFTNEGWDFVGEDVNSTDDFWRMCVDGIDYPKLSWQFLVGDFLCPDGVDLIDFAVLAETWSLSSGQTGYNDLCDLIDDDTIDLNDLAVFAENWLCY